ncbi:MAG: iron-regulated protein [Marinilabiliales bacterium]|nr:MAG: iron-regulated protein [Marinilabiliales bacterium]
MIKSIILIIALSSIFLGFDRHKPAYVIYNEEGREVSYRRMMRAISGADILLFGELHDNPISHWLQYEVTNDLHGALDGRIMLAAEMFEADNQLILDEYLRGLISESRFEDEAKLWRNYRTDYKPLVEFAKENSIPFIASNIPRRYANMVFRGGFEALEQLGSQALGYIAPLPVEYDPDLPGYSAMLEMSGGGMGHAGENLPKAQAIKDATMAHFMLENHEPGRLLIHFHGTYHSDNFEGIYWYLTRRDPGLNIVTVSTTLQKETGTLDESAEGRANFIIVVPETMTRTY